jgi:E3 ubiquitin-protein ligase RNF115/126
MLAQMLESMTPLHGNPGDYLRPGMTMDDLITQLMDQGHTSAPPPASTDAIDSLPRIKADKALVEGGKECTVCKENLSLGEDVIRLPCLHVLYVSFRLYFLGVLTSG